MATSRTAEAMEAGVEVAARNIRVLGREDYAGGVRVRFVVSDGSYPPDPAARPAAPRVVVDDDCVCVCQFCMCVCVCVVEGCRLESGVCARVHCPPVRHHPHPPPPPRAQQPRFVITAATVLAAKLGLVGLKAGFATVHGLQSIFSSSRRRRRRGICDDQWGGY